MKKLIMFAAVLGLASVGQAESEWTNNAEYRVRGAVNSGETLTNDKSSNVINHRLKLTTNYKASDKFSGTVTLIHHADFGAQNTSTNIPNTATRDQLGQASGLIVNEAYATWRVSDEFSLKMGRGSFEGADGSSTAVNDYQNALTAFDGVAGIYDHEFARITGYLIKFADVIPGGGVAPTDVNDPEVNTFGVAADLKFAPELFNIFNVYANQVRKDQGVGSLGSEAYLKYGIVMAGTVADMVNFKVAYHGYNGESEGAKVGDITGSMIDAELGVTMEDMMNMNFTVGYHTDSGNSNSTAAGDDEHFRSYYYDTHKFAGLMDVVKWGNLSYIHAGFSMEPLENLTLGLKYHMFTATEEAGATYRTTDSSAAPTIAAGSTTEDEIGNEIDLYAVHKYDGGFEIEARYGLFMTGDRFGPNAEDFQQFFLSGTMKF